MALYQTWKLKSVTLDDGNGGVVSGPGEVDVSDLGRVVIRIAPSQPIGFLDGKLSISGTSTAGQDLSAEGSMTRVEQNGVRIEVRPLWIKFFEPGIPQTADLCDSVKWHIKNVKFLIGPANTSFSGIKFQIEPLLPVPLAHHQLEGQISCKIAASGGPWSIDQANEIMDATSRLVGFAQRCSPPPIIKEYSSGGKLLFVEITEHTMDSICLQPCIEWYADDTANFVAKSFDTYVAKKDKFGLVTLLEYYWLSHQNHIAEIKFLFASVLMESFKFKWAEKVATHLEADVNKATGLIRGFRNKGGPQTGKGQFSNIDFEGLLVQAANDVGCSVAKGTYTFIDDRNCLFHSGLSSAAQLAHPSSWTLIKPKLQTLYSQIDEILLRILDYNGSYFPFNYGNPGRPKNFP